MSHALVYIAVKNYRAITQRASVQFAPLILYCLILVLLLLFRFYYH